MPSRTTTPWPTGSTSRSRSCERCRRSSRRLAGWRRTDSAGGGAGVAEQEALAQVHAEGHERRRLGLGLDPLADDPAAGGGGEVLEPGDEGLAGRVAVDLVDPGAVQLDEGGFEDEDVAQRGEARAG